MQNNIQDIVRFNSLNQKFNFNSSATLAIIIHSNCLDILNDILLGVKSYADDVDIYILANESLSSGVFDLTPEVNYIQISWDRAVSEQYKLIQLLNNFDFSRYNLVFNLDYNYSFGCESEINQKSGEDVKRNRIANFFSWQNYQNVKNLFYKMPRLGILTSDSMYEHVELPDGLRKNFNTLIDLDEVTAEQLFPRYLTYTQNSIFWFRPQALNLFARLGITCCCIDNLQHHNCLSDSNLVQRMYISLILSGYFYSDQQRINIFNSTRENSALSILTRFHDIKKIHYIENLAKKINEQSYTDIDWIICTKNFSSIEQADVKRVCQSFKNIKKIRVINVDVEPGVDGRSKLLNIGIKNASGRYLSFLDYDDSINADFAKLHIEVLKNSDFGISVSGCSQVYIDAKDGRIITKSFPYSWGQSIDLLWHNFIPIHSYVIDCEKVQRSDIYFDEVLDRVEDYDFLLRLYSRYSFSFILHKLPLSDYYIRNDGSNTTLELNQNSDELNRSKWIRCEGIIKYRKRDLNVNLNVLEVCNYIDQMKNEISKKDNKISMLSKHYSELNAHYAEKVYKQDLEIKQFDKNYVIFKKLIKNFFSKNKYIYYLICKTYDKTKPARSLIVRLIYILKSRSDGV